ncbi:MAG: hypothetical protein ACRD82_17155, partial [Blastocatellia bacterium]
MPQVLLNAAGPLPLSVTFAAESDDPITFFVAGSCWTQTTNAEIGFAVILDGTQIGVATIFSNGPTTHRAVVPQFIPWQFDEMGNHTLELVALP